MKKMTNSNWKFYDAAKDAKGKVLKLNCTTRAITYALNGNYDEVFGRQNDIAEKCLNTFRTIRYNSDETTDKILRDAGYQCIDVGGYRAGEFAKLVVNSKHPIVIETSGHLTICDKGEVVDTWDSTRRFVACAWVKEDDMELVKNINIPNNCWTWGKEISAFERFMFIYKSSMVNTHKMSEEKVNELVEAIIAA